MTKISRKDAEAFREYMSGAARAECGFKSFNFMTGALMNRAFVQQMQDALGFSAERMESLLDKAWDILDPEVADYETIEMNYL